MADPNKKYDFSDFDQTSYDFSDFEDVQPQRTIQDKMPEGLAWPRFLIKNLGQDEMQSLAYLNREYGDKYDFDIDKGSIIAKKKGENTWGKLDPSGFDIQDISDVGYDVLAGIGTGAATALGGVGGSAVSLGLGGIPGAMAAGAGSSAALEGLRQGLGNLAGVSSGVDKGSLVLSTALGAASPLAFGSGATKSAISNALAKDPFRMREILIKEGALDVLKKTPEKALDVATDIVARQNKSAIGRAFPAIGEFFSGAARETIGGLTEETLPEVKKVLSDAKLFKGGSLTNLEAIDLLKKVPEGDLKLSQEMIKGIKTATRKSLKDVNDDYESAKNIAVSAMDSGSIPPINVENAAGETIRNAIADIANSGKLVDGQMVLTKDQKNTIRKLESAYKDILTIDVPEVDPKTGLPKLVKQPLGDVDLRQSMMVEKGLAARFLREKSDPNPLLKRVLGTALTNLSAANDEILEQVSPGLVQQYKTMKPISEILRKLTHSPETYAQKMRGTSAESKRVLFDRLREGDALMGTNNEAYAKFQDIKSLFQRPSWEPITTKGSTSTSRTIAVSKLAELLKPLGGVGELASMFSGKAISPAMIKILTKANKTIGTKSAPVELGLKARQKFLDSLLKIGKPAQAIGKSATSIPTWIQMRNERGD